MGFINELRERANSLFFRQMKLERERNKAMEAEKLEAEIKEREQTIEALESDFAKLSVYPSSNHLFEALSNLAQRRQAEFNNQQQRHFLKAEIVQELQQEFDEQIGAMQTQIAALTATVNAVIEESQRHRQEFRKRQQQRETAAVVREVTNQIFSN